MSEAMSVVVEKNEVVYNILFTTPEYEKLFSGVCTLIEVGGVQWLETATCERGILTD